jgi:hypothetical protein
VAKGGTDVCGRAAEEAPQLLARLGAVGEGIAELQRQLSDAMISGSEAGALPAIHLHVRDSGLAEDLLDFLRRAECRAERTGEDRIEVHVPRALSEEQARREVSLYVATWRARHPSADVFLVD